MKLATLPLILVLAAGCDQQSNADLAACKMELTKLQTDISTAKSAQTAIEQKLAEVESKAKEASDQLAQAQKSIDETAKAASDKVSTVRAATAKKVAATKAEIKEDAAKADVKLVKPVQQMTNEEKAKAGGF